MSTSPIAAVRLASALVQVLDFSINTLRKEHAIYQPTNDISPVDNATILQDIVNTLYRLTDVVDQSDLKKQQDDKPGQKKNAKPGEAAQQLIKQSEQVKELVEGLRDAFIAAQALESPDGTIWPTARDALLNGAWKKKDITSAKKKLRALRRDVDTTLLLALRQHLDQDAKAGLPVSPQDDSDASLGHLEKWQNEALDAINTNDWKPNRKKNVEDFVTIVDKLITAENEAHFCEETFKLLWFDESDERLHSIATPMAGSMNWVFSDERMQDEGALLDWLGNTRGEHLFWLTGRPGSGKSVLTKYLFRNPHVFDYLEAWSGSAPGITAAYTFWNCGTELQNSPVGLLRTVLYEALQDMIYGPLEQGRDILQLLFQERWEQFKSYGGGLHDLSFAELRTAFELMISDTDKKFLFMIDGLEEMQEYSIELVDTIISATQRENVKMIVSSCESPEYAEAFRDRPKLVLHEWTRRDSQAHILHTFDDWDALKSLRARPDNVEEMNVINTLAEKADGVYLWAKLATAFILQGLEEGDSFTALRYRAGELPHTLESLLSHIVDSLPPDDAKQFWKITTLLESHTHASPNLIPLSFALTSDTKEAIAADTKPLKSAEISKRIDDMRTLLDHTCSSLLTIFDTTPPPPDSSPSPSPSPFPSQHYYLKISYTHRTIRTFLSIHHPHPNIPVSYNPTTQWAASHLWSLKMLNPSASHIWPALAASLESALRMYDRANVYPLTYIESAVSAALSHHLKASLTSDIPSFPTNPSTTLTTFLDVAVLLNFTGYIALKARDSDKKDIRHAIDFSREVRKRLGKDGEMRWLGGKGRERLREEYGGERAEVESVLVAWGKDVKDKSGKEKGVSRFSVGSGSKVTSKDGKGKEENEAGMALEVPEYE
jgi:hypothetical protein